MDNIKDSTPEGRIYNETEPDFDLMDEELKDLINTTGMRDHEIDTHSRIGIFLKNDLVELKIQSLDSIEGYVAIGSEIPSKYSFIKQAKGLNLYLGLQDVNLDILSNISLSEYSNQNIELTNVIFDIARFTVLENEFNTINEISKKVNNETLILFWQFTIKALEELDIVSNQHLSMEMFLIRLIHLKGIKNKYDAGHARSQQKNENTSQTSLSKKKDDEDLFGIKDKAETIGQIKNVAQEKDVRLKDNKESKTQVNLINSFEDLLEICSTKKEIKLKYELEKNVNLVSFEDQRIEISFNESLDKDFIKDLSLKLYEWTNNRWIITLSKTKGRPSKKEAEVNSKKELVESIKNSPIYKNILEKFPDAELIDVKTNKEKDKND